MKLNDSHPKLFLKAEHHEPDNHEFRETLKDIGIFHYWDGEDGIINLIYFTWENEFGEKGYEWFSVLFNQQFPWFSEKIKNWDSPDNSWKTVRKDRIAEKIYNKYFYKFPFKQPIDFLVKINGTEYLKIIENIRIIEKDKIDNNKYDNIETDAFNEIILRLQKFRKEFVKWFYKNNAEIPKPEETQAESDTLNISPLDRGDLTVKEYTELLFIEARKDEREGAHLEWKITFLDEIGKANTYPTLGRIRKKFKQKNPDKKFNINGMAWYRKS